MSELTLTTYRPEPESESSANIESLKPDSLSRYGNMNLTDLFNRVPGVQILSTGPFVTNPVIRDGLVNQVSVKVTLQ